MTEVSLIEAASHIPIGFVLRIESEPGEDGPFLTAVVSQHAPGWEPGDVFDEDDPEHGWKDGHPASRFLDRPVFGITAVDAACFHTLLTAAILKRWPTPYVKWDGPMSNPELADAISLAREVVGRDGAMRSDISQRLARAVLALWEHPR